MSRLYRNPGHAQYGSGVFPGGHQANGRNQSGLNSDTQNRSAPEYHQFATHSPKATNPNPYQQPAMSNMAAQGLAAGQKVRDGDLYYDRFAKNTGSVPNLNSTGPYMVQNPQQVSIQQSNMQPYGGGTPQAQRMQNNMTPVNNAAQQFGTLQQPASNDAYGAMGGQAPAPQLRRSSDSRQYLQQAGQNTMADQSPYAQQPQLESQRKSVQFAREEGQAQRSDIQGERKKERLANDLMKICGPQQFDLIQQNMAKVDARALIGLSEPDYQLFLQAFSRQMETQAQQLQQNQGQQQYNINTQNNAGAPGNLGTNPLTGSPVKRHLPVSQKKMVYNEWGAIIQHQDEMAEAQRKSGLEKQKQLRDMYRLDLDQQKLEAQRKLQQNREMDNNLANEMLDYQRGVDQRKARNEDDKKNQLKNDVIRKQKESFEEAERAKVEAKDLADRQRIYHRESYLQMQKDQAVEDSRLKREREMNANQYYKDLNGQERDRKYRTQAELEQDRLYAQLEVAQQDKTEHRRKDFFNHMQGFQDANDAKTANLRDFMEGRDLASLEKIDEARYLQAMQEKEIKDRKQAEMEALQNANAKNSNLSALQRQMMEKDQQRRLQKMEDDAFAQIIKQKVVEGDFLDAKKKAEYRARAKNFTEGLIGQMDEAEQKKKYGDLMTEHERRVNDPDMQAYEDQKNELYGKLPGVGISYETEKQQKFTQGALGQRSPGGYNSKADVVIGSGQQNAYGQNPPAYQKTPIIAQQHAMAQQNLQKTKEKNHRSQLLIGGLNQLGPSAQGFGQQPKYSQGQLDQVKTNMMNPNAYNFRANTGNTVFGFNQVIDDQNHGLLHQPNGVGVPTAINNGAYDPSQNGPNTYQYAAPGNLGALQNRKAANHFNNYLKYSMQKI